MRDPCTFCGREYDDSMNWSYLDGISVVACGTCASERDVRARIAQTLELADLLVLAVDPTERRIRIRPVNVHARLYVLYRDGRSTAPTSAASIRWACIAAGNAAPGHVIFGLIDDCTIGNDPR